MNGITHNIIEDRGCDDRFIVFSGTLFGCEKWMADNTIEHPLNNRKRCRLDESGDELMRNNNGEPFVYEIGTDDTEYSFQKGWYQLRQHQVAEARNKIMAKFGITTRMAFLKRLNGKTMGMQAERDAIEAIFAEYGITEVWGNYENSRY